MPITKNELDNYFSQNYNKLCKDVDRLIYLRGSDISSGDVVVSECYICVSAKIDEFNDLQHLEGYIINYISNHTRWYNSGIRKYNDKQDRNNSLEDDLATSSMLINTDGDIDMESIYNSLLERYKYLLGHWRKTIFNYWLEDINTYASFKDKFPGFTRSYISQILKEQKEIVSGWRAFVIEEGIEI